MSSNYDRAAAQRALSEFRQKRRSATPETVVSLCQALGFEFKPSRGKGSHGVAVRARTNPITIPRHIGLRIATGILTTLEEVFDNDATDKEQPGSR